jgi:hypothetical protein
MSKRLARSRRKIWRRLLTWRLGGDLYRQWPEVNWSSTRPPDTRRRSSSDHACGQESATQKARMGSIARRQSEGPSIASEIRPLARVRFVCGDRPSQPVPDFVAPQHRHKCAFLGEAGQDAKAIAPVCFVFQKPLKRQRRIQYKIAHRRWPSCIKSFIETVSSRV